MRETVIVNAVYSMKVSSADTFQIEKITSKVQRRSESYHDSCFQAVIKCRDVTVHSRINVEYTVLPFQFLILRMNVEDSVLPLPFLILRVNVEHGTIYRFDSAPRRLVTSWISVRLRLIQIINALTISL